MRKLNLAPLALMLLALAACTVNPEKTAATATSDNEPETIALATFGLFVIAEEGAAAVKEMPGTPQEVKDALKKADALASPAAESLRDAALEVQGLRAIASAGGSGAESLPAKLEALNKLLTETAPRLKTFIDAYHQAKGTSP